MQFGGGISIVSVTDGEPEITFMTERTVEVFDRYFNLIEKGVNVDIDLGNAFRKGNVAFISAKQQSEALIYMHILSFLDFFLYRSLQHIG